MRVYILFLLSFFCIYIFSSHECELPVFCKPRSDGEARVIGDFARMLYYQGTQIATDLACVGRLNTLLYELEQGPDNLGFMQGFKVSFEDDEEDGKGFSGGEASMLKRKEQILYTTKTPEERALVLLHAVRRGADKGRHGLESVDGGGRDTKCMVALKSQREVDRLERFRKSGCDFAPTAHALLATMLRGYTEKAWWRLSICFLHYPRCLNLLRACAYMQNAEHLKALCTGVTSMCDYFSSVSVSREYFYQDTDLGLEIEKHTLLDVEKFNEFQGYADACGGHKGILAAFHSLYGSAVSYLHTRRFLSCFKMNADGTGSLLPRDIKLEEQECDFTLFAESEKEEVAVKKKKRRKKKRKKKKKKEGSGVETATQGVSSEREELAEESLVGSIEAEEKEEEPPQYFEYAPRVYKQRDKDPEHGFTEALDALASTCGVESVWENSSTGHADTRYSLSGELNGVPGVFSWTVGEDGKCYHRCFTRKNNNEMMQFCALNFRYSLLARVIAAQHVEYGPHVHASHKKSVVRETALAIHLCDPRFGVPVVVYKVRQ